VEILYETDHVVMKHIGDIFKGNQDWEKIVREVIQKGVRKKFPQNSDFASMLKSDDKKGFLEHNHYDLLWGSRTSLSDGARQR